MVRVKTSRLPQASIKNKNYFKRPALEVCHFKEKQSSLS